MLYRFGPESTKLNRVMTALRQEQRYFNPDVIGQLTYLQTDATAKHLWLLALTERVINLLPMVTRAIIYQRTHRGNLMQKLGGK